MLVSMAMFQMNAFNPVGLFSPRNFLLLFNIKNPMYAIGSIIPAIAEVGMAIQAPIYFQRMTPNTPGIGNKHASKYLLPFGGMPSTSQIAKPHVNI